MYFIFLLTAAVVSVFPSLSYAMDTDYTIYNGFIPMYNSLMKLSLISSNGNYQSLFAMAVVVSIFLAGMVNFSKMAMGGHGNPVAWVPPLIMGIFVYFAMFSSTGTVHLYDPVLNRTGDVGGVPDGIVAVMAITNSVETGFVDLISTSGVPGDYQHDAGGIGFNMLANTISAPVSAPEAASSLNSYVKDCVLFEVVRPGTTLTWSALMTSSDIMSTLALAENLSVFTTSYLDNNGKVANPYPADPSTDCTTAYSRLQLYYSNNAATNMANVKQALCTQSAYATDSSSLSTCGSTFSDTTNLVASSTDAMESYLAQNEVSQQFLAAVKAASPTQAAALLTDRSMTNGVTAGFAIAKWIPQLKATFTAAILALLPAIFIFIPTGICGRAMSLIMGFFILIMSWGICDAVLHSVMMDYAVPYFSNVKDSGKSLYYYLSFPDNATSTMAMFGYMRGFGLSLASLISFQLGKFGGAQLASLGTAVMSGLQSSGTQSSDVATSPDKKGAFLNSMLSGTGGLANVASHSTSELMGASAWQAMSGTEQSLGSREAHHGSLPTVRALSNYEGGTRLATMAGEVNEMGSVNNALAGKSEAAGVNLARNVGGARAERNMFASLKSAGMISPNANFHDYLQQRQSQGNFVDTDGSVISFSAGEDGHVLASKSSTSSEHGGYTTTVASQDGTHATTKIESPGAWTAVLDSSGHMVSNSNKAISGSLRSDFNTKMQKDALDNFRRRFEVGDSKDIDWKHMEKSGFSKEKVETFSHAFAHEVADQLSREHGLSKDQKKTIENMLYGKIAGDQRTIGAMVGLASGGVAGAAAGAYLGKRAEELLGIRMEVGGQRAHKTSTNAAVTEALKTVNAEGIKNAIQHATSDTSKYSKSIEDVKSAAFKMMVSDKSGVDQTAKLGYSYEKGVGFSVSENVEMSFVQHLANNDPRFSGISDTAGRLAAVNNFLGANPQEAGNLFYQYMNEYASHNATMATNVANVDNGHAAQEQSFEARVKEVSPQVNAGQTSIIQDPYHHLNVPGAEGSENRYGLSFMSDHTVANIGGANGHIIGSERLMGMFNSMPDPGSFGKPGALRTDFEIVKDKFAGSSIANNPIVTALGGANKALGQVNDGLHDAMYGKEH